MENSGAETKPTCCGSTVWIPRAGLFIFLFVLLRMTVGWHFIFEGIAKIYSTYTPKPFSSAGYFRESPGPMKALMGNVLPPDPDKEMVKKLNPSEIQDALRKIGEDFAGNLGLSGPDKAKVQDLVEKQVKDALFWREGGNPQIRFAFEKALTGWERGGTEELKKQALEKRSKVIGLLKEFQSRQADLATQVTAFSGPISKLNFTNPDPARLDRVPLDLTDPSNIAQVRSAVLAEAEKVMLDPWKGKTEPLAVEQWKKWDKVVAIADKWADATQEWLTSGEESLEEPSPDGKGSGTLKKVVSTPDRVQRYEGLVAKKEEILHSDKNWLFRKDVEKGALATVRASAASARTSLGGELEKFKTDLNSALEKQFADQMAKSPPAKATKEVKPIEILDLMTIWGITAIGAGLFTGTLTRMAALAGAAFLAMTYLAVPAFPWLPAPPQNEGNYVFVNKNVVEMMALLVIAAAPSGRWFGGDAILAWLFGSRSGKERNS